MDESNLDDGVSTDSTDQANGILSQLTGGVVQVAENLTQKPSPAVVLVPSQTQPAHVGAPMNTMLLLGVGGFILLALLIRK